MDDGEALIRAIRANRDDDTPRLVYADWLEEQGDHARAEFVRLQCWLSAHPESDPEWEAKWQREQKLLRQHGNVWVDQLGGYFDEVSFDRGFPAYFDVGQPDELMWVLPDLAGLTATDRVVVGWVEHDSFGRMAREPAFGLIHELVFSDDVRWLRPELARWVVGSEHAQQLRRLDLSAYWQQWDEPAETQLLTVRDGLPELQHLHLSVGSVAP